jgi:hypothetical protein
MFIHISEAMQKRPNDWIALDDEDNVIDRDEDLGRLDDRLKAAGHEDYRFSRNWFRPIPKKYLTMKTFYVTFGQVHAHHLPGRGTFDKDCVAVIRANSYEEGREKAFNMFGAKWSNFYTQENPPTMEYYPRGLMETEYDLV